MMAAQSWCVSILTAVICVNLAFSEEFVQYGFSKPCKYFVDSRWSSSQGNLVNCTWYASNACCKRTEVTSVFGGMYPLYGASLHCKNQLNYMMCYFCSPEQYRWYHKTVHVCAEFCHSVYESCKTAEYGGVAVGDRYASGEDFCHGQKFRVVEPGNGDCFAFDPDVFDGIAGMHPSLNVLFLAALVVHLVVLCS